MSVNSSLGLYIHIPWCIRKCPYCDFNSHEFGAELPEAEYITALLTDLDQDLQHYQETRAISSIFIGGGTPSLFSAQALEDLLIGIEKRLNFADDIEITLEANPGTFESNKFSAFRAIGINRLSIGVQSFNDAMLKQLGRIHDAGEAIKAVEIAGNAGFNNCNIDLMFGLPQSNIDTSISDLTTAIQLQPSHISFYQLTLEPNTYFHKFPPPLPSDDDIYSVQQNCREILAANGYQQYEISAFSQRQKQCQHNVNYWQFGDYLGIGAGAHGKITRSVPGHIERFWKYKNPQQYLSGLKSGQFTGSSQTILRSELPLEFLMNHLRLKTGFALTTYQAQTGLDLSTLEPVLSECIGLGLLRQTQDTISCTVKGWDFLDLILEKFLG
jgi:oxygen-independent coproporphyrinogen-3 oxidase